MATRRRSVVQARASRTFKRKQFQWKYVSLEEQAVPRGGGVVDIVVADSTDWQTGTTAADNVRNLSFDLSCGLTWTPETTALAFDSWGWRSGLFTLDDDETPDIDQVFAEHRALRWFHTARNTAEVPALSVHADWVRAVNWKYRGTARFLRFGEELRLLSAFENDTTATLADARLWIFGRVSWEVP